MRQLLLAPQWRESREWNVQRTSGLVDGMSQQRVRRQFGENAVTVFKRSLNGSSETYGVPEIISPVIGIQVRFVTRVVQGRRVVGNRRLERCQILQRLQQVVQDGINLW